jgi:hypothetical protein
MNETTPLPEQGLGDVNVRPLKPATVEDQRVYDSIAENYHKSNPEYIEALHDRVRTLFRNMEDMIHELVSAMSDSEMENANRQAGLEDSLIAQLREVALHHGYAIVVHWSRESDLDLIACPLTQQAEAEAFVSAIQAAVMTIVGSSDGEAKMNQHGQLTWSFHTVGGPVKLIVMPADTPREAI